MNLGLRFARNGIWLVLAAACLAPGLSRAHGDLHERILQISNQLAQTPADPELRLQRAMLYVSHQEFAPALADLAELEKLRPGWDSALLLRAQTMLESGQFQPALELSAAFLKTHPGRAEALMVAAQALVKLDRAAEGALRFSEVIRSVANPAPELYLQRAAAWAAAGRIEEAVRGLDEGIKKLGLLPSLQLPAIAYERQLKHFDAALARVNKLAANTPRPESALTLGGEILEEAGRFEAAGAMLRQAQASLDSLPPNRRHLDLTQQLQSRISGALERIGRQRTAQPPNLALQP